MADDDEWQSAMSNWRKKRLQNTPLASTFHDPLAPSPRESLELNSTAPAAKVNVKTYKQIVAEREKQSRDDQIDFPDASFEVSDKHNTRPWNTSIDPATDVNGKTDWKHKEAPGDIRLSSTSAVKRKRTPPKVAPKPSKPKTEISENFTSRMSHYEGEHGEQHCGRTTFFYFVHPSGEEDTNQNEDSLVLTVTEDSSLMNSGASFEAGGFGFGLTGGKDFSTPLCISSVVSDGSVDLCSLREGDEILSINGFDMTSLTHDEVVAVMSSAVQSGNLCLRINRQGFQVTCGAPMAAEASPDRKPAGKQVFEPVRDSSFTRSTEADYDDEEEVDYSAQLRMETPVVESSNDAVRRSKQYFENLAKNDRLKDAEQQVKQSRKEQEQQERINEQANEVAAPEVLAEMFEEEDEEGNSEMEEFEQELAHQREEAVRLHALQENDAGDDAHLGYHINTSHSHSETLSDIREETPREKDEAPDVTRSTDQRSLKLARDTPRSNITMSSISGFSHPLGGGGGDHMENEDFLAEKKKLEQKQRDEKKLLFMHESERIDYDRQQFEELEAQLRRSNQPRKLREAQMSFAEDQQAKEKRFEEAVNDLKAEYQAKLQQLIDRYDPQKANPSADHTPREEMQLGNLSPRKYDSIRKWAEDTSQQVQDPVDDIKPTELKAVKQSQSAISHAPQTREEVVEEPFMVKEVKTSRSIMRPVVSEKLPVFSSESKENKPPGVIRADEPSVSKSGNMIKRRPISGVTRNHDHIPQMYYTSQNPPRNNYAQFQKDVNGFNHWLDTLTGDSNGNLPKVSRPKSAFYVQRIDQPLGERDPNVGNPLPDDIIDAIMSRLDGSRPKSSKDTGKFQKNGGSRKMPDKYSSNVTPSNMRKWRSAPNDLDDEEAEHFLTDTALSHEDLIFPGSRTQLNRTAPAPLLSSPSPVPAPRTSKAQPPLPVDVYENVPKQPPSLPKRDPPPVPKQQVNGHGTYTKGHGFRPDHVVAQNGQRVEPRAPNPDPHWREVDPRHIGDSGGGEDPRRSTRSLMPPREPPQVTEFPVRGHSTRDRTSAPRPMTLPQHFQEMSVDSPGRGPSAWKPPPENSANGGIPWNPRANDFHDPSPDASTLTRRFQFRDAKDPYGFNTLSRNANTPGSGDRTPVTPTGMSQEHQQTLTRPSKGHRVSSKEPCSKCGLMLGKGSAVLIESLNLFFHHECFKCNICLKQLQCADIGTNVRVRGSSVHCEACFYSEGGYEFTRC